MSDPQVVVSGEAADPRSHTAATVSRPRFRCLDSDEPAQVVLHQINHRDFQLMQGFRYNGRSGSWSVLPDDLPDTDLASIPRFLGWFVKSYGQHTLAALLHDHLVRNPERVDPPVSRPEADIVFREALDELGVPYLRSRIMWASVTLVTRWWASWLARLGMILWMVCAGIGVTTIVAAITTGNLPLLLVALVAPIPFSLLWGWRYFYAGVVGGYTLWFVSLPTLFSMLAYGIYMGAEWIVLALRLIHPFRPPPDVPAPSGPPPSPYR